MIKTTIANVICKLVWFSLVLETVAWIHPDTYLTVFPLFVTVVVLTVVGATADWLIPPRVGNLPALLLGLPGMMVIVWGLSHLFPTANVGWWTAFVIAICIGPIEYLLHRVILQRIGV